MTLLMWSTADRQRPIQDLEWMVAPALMSGQFAVADAQSKDTGMVTPVATVLWAMVSEEVDQRLSQTVDKLAQLKPADWRSGDIPWIVSAIGEPNVVGGLLQQLTKTVFKDRPQDACPRCGRQAGRRPPRIGCPGRVDRLSPFNVP